MAGKARTDLMTQSKSCQYHIKLAKRKGIPSNVQDLAMQKQTII